MHHRQMDRWTGLIWLDTYCKAGGSVSFFGNSRIKFGKNTRKRNTVEPLITVTSAQRPPLDLRSAKKVPTEFKVKLSLKNLPTAVISNQRLHGHFVVFQCLILPLLTVKKATLCKPNKRKMKKVCFIYLENIYFLKIIYFWTYCRGHQHVKQSWW